MWNIFYDKLIIMVVVVFLAFHQASAFSASYSDSGLFGFCVVADSSNVAKVTTDKHSSY